LQSRHLVPLLLSIWLAAVDAGAQPLATGPRLAGLSGAGIALPNEQYGGGNPASIADFRGISLALAASRAFGLPELDHYRLSGGVGAGIGNVSLSFESFGFDQFRLLTGHLVLACRLLQRTAGFGVRVSYGRLTVARYGSAGHVRAGAGFRMQVGSAAYIGFTADNLFRSASNISDGARRLVLGVAIRATSTAMLLADVEKVESFDPSLKAGLEVVVLHRIAVRLGFSTFPDSFSIGFGADVGLVGIDFGGVRHRALGWARAVGVVLER
jgi:hypothetical protein